MFSLKIILGTDRIADFLTNSKALVVVDTSSLFLIVLLALGPTIKLPWTVLETKTPFPSSFGVWKITWLTNSPCDLSSK